MLRHLYLDSSILASLALKDEGRAKLVLQKIEESDEIGTSEVAVVECQAGLSAQLSGQGELLVLAEQNLNQILARMTLYSVESVILGHARALVKQHRVATELRTLDAIHVATANVIRLAYLHSQEFFLEYMTCDRKQHAAFTAEGHVGRLVA